LARFQRDGDRAARAVLVERFLPLARQIARRYQRPHEPLDDLEQVASVGLVKAIDRFDPRRGTAFSTFAVPTIVGELKRYFRDRGWALRVPRELQDDALNCDRTSSLLTAELGHSPTTRQLSDATGLTTERVLAAIEAAGAYRTLSLDRPAAGDEDGESLGAGLGVEEPGFAHAEERALLAQLSGVLSKRQRQVLQLRFDEGLTQSEIGAIVGISQMHVSRLLRQALARLRIAAGTDG
jgi:RNA polymerase sigma-B factor